MLKVLSDIVLGINAGDLSAQVLLDLSATFDTIDHHILLQRLERSYGMLVWFQSYLVGSCQFVRFGSSTSSAALILCGVPQESVLGPILFLLCTADLLLLIRAMVSVLICMQMTPKSVGSAIRLQRWSFRTASLPTLMMWPG